MRFILFSISILTLLFACRNTTSVKNTIENEADESVLVVEEDFVDEYSQYEFFQLERYIVNDTDIPIDSITNTSETCYVQVWRPEIKKFEDEESEEAEAYFTAMDDFSYYMYEASEHLKNLNIPDTTIYLRFVRFDIGDSKTIVVDTEKHESKVAMLLYKKGKNPLIIDIVMNDIDRARSYLNIN